MSVCGQFFQLKKNDNAKTSHCKNTRNGPRSRCCMLFCFNFSPSKTEYLYHFKNDGFKGPMLGKWKDGVHKEEMEFGYDLTDISSGFDLRKPLKYFFTIQREDYEDEGTLSFLSVKDYAIDSVVQELVVADDTVKLSDQGRYEWAFVMPGNPAAAVDYVLSGDYAIKKIPHHRFQEFYAKPPGLEPLYGLEIDNSEQVPC